MKTGEICETGRYVVAHFGATGTEFLPYYLHQRSIGFSRNTGTTIRNLHFTANIQSTELFSFRGEAESIREKVEAHLEKMKHVLAGKIVVLELCGKVLKPTED